MLAGTGMASLRVITNSINITAVGVDATLVYIKAFSSISVETSFASTIVRSHDIVTNCIDITAMVISCTLVYNFKTSKVVTVIA